MPFNSLTAGSLTTAIVASFVVPISDSAMSAPSNHGASIARYVNSGSAAAPSRVGISSDLNTKVELDWVRNMSNNARRLEELKAGWDGPGSIPISQKILFKATSLAREALAARNDVSPPHLVPGGDGSVQIEWHKKHGELELDIDAHGRVSIWVRDHRNGAEFDAEGDTALALFYRWAPWIAAIHRDAGHEALQAQVFTISVAA